MLTFMRMLTLILMLMFMPMLTRIRMLMLTLIPKL